jgi:acid phosphatase family membrane protein YuiD
MISQRAVELVTRILAHPVFLSAFSSWFIAQILKSAVALFRNRPRTAREILLNLFWTTGGMPSSHSAVVAALATSLLTFRDALGVRRAAGAQAKVLNQLIRDLSKRRPIRARPVKEIHGHTLSEVFVGALLGFFIALAFSTL